MVDHAGDRRTSRQGPRARHVVVGGGLLLSLAWPAWGAAQPPPSQIVGQETQEGPDASGPDVPARTAEALEAQLAELAPELVAAEGAATEESARRLGVTLAALTGYADRLQALGGLLQQQVGASQRLAELAASEADLEREVETFHTRGLDDPPPYSLTVADRHRDEAAAEERQADSLDSTLESARSERQSAETRLQEAQRARRRSRDLVELNGDASQTPRLAWELERAQLEERFAQEALNARRLREDVAAAEVALSRRRLTFLRERAETVASQTTFTPQELEQRLHEIATARDELERSLPRLRDGQQTSEALRRETREQLQTASGDAEIAALTAELASRTAAVDTAARAVELAEKHLELSGHERELWDRRYALRQGADDRELTQWRVETRALLVELEGDRQVQQARLLDLRSSIVELERILGGTPEDDAASVQRSRVDALRQREQTVTAYLGALLPVERLARRLEEEIDGELSSVTWAERWDRLRASAAAVWNFELFVFEDDAITVRKIVIALLILTIGIFVAGRLTGTLRGRLVERKLLNEDAAAALEVLVYYAALIGVGLYTLNFVRIPLTLFAFFGGALALAVGFGAQHIINNFISGFILMIERPIRIGDLVQVDGTYGHIKQIRARSTRIHTPDNIDLLVPNSRLLENTVINWTLSDEKLRTSVTVGVMYGSPADTVTRLLREACAASTRVLEAPAPIVLFTDFGDNALTFDVHFWIRMRRIMDKRQAESEVRYNVERLFRAQGIVIAFPQRDVHLDAMKPIEVRMVPADREGATAACPSESTLAPAAPRGVPARSE